MTALEAIKNLFKIIYDMKEKGFDIDIQNEAEILGSRAFQKSLIKQEKRDELLELYKECFLNYIRK